VQAKARGRVEAAYLEHHAALVRHLTMITRDPEVAQDLAHEAFLRLARAFETGTAPDDAAAWLHRVGMNLATSRGRHLQVVDRRAALLARPAEAVDPGDIVTDGELARAVHAVMGQLSRPEQDALLLAAHGYGGPEIAMRIGRTPGATRTLLCRARGKVRDRVLAAGFAPA
jgi:RNA polymerase sigma-70 factor (ECF subfamily)